LPPPWGCSAHPRAVPQRGFAAPPRPGCRRPARAPAVSRGAAASFDGSAQYELDAEFSKTSATARTRRSAQDRGNSGGFFYTKDNVQQYALGRPLELLQRVLYLGSIALGIWWAWRTDAEPRVGAYDAGSFSQAGPASERGMALRDGLAEMGVFFVKMGQTFAQRPDLVGDDLAEELKGLQERNAPFDDGVALRIIAEDLGHRGPLAPGVLYEGCDPSGPTLLKELDPKHVASASLGQVYRGRLHDGREVALKVQRPGARDKIGLDWAIAVGACKVYRELARSSNDYSLIVDTVAAGIQLELDYHEEARNAQEFAVRHRFLPFVSSPAWVPEYTGPEGSANVLCLEWYPSRAPSELSREERRRLVEMAAEACVIQLLVTGFVHADPHEGNLRMGDDGRVVFLDFGLMDNVDFGVMESFSAGIRSVLGEDWPTLVQAMQDARFTPTPLMKKTPEGAYQECSPQEFAEAVARQLKADQGGLSRFGAMAVALKALSDEYLMLTPPYVALLARTFITLEGMLGDDPEMAEKFNIYEVALPFAMTRLISPRTRRGQRTLRSALLESPPEGHAGPDGAMPRWETLLSLVEGQPEEHDGTGPGAAEDPFGARQGVQARLLQTSEGAFLRRLLYDVDLLAAARDFLTSKKTRPLRHKAISALAARWAAGPSAAPQRLGPRCAAAAVGWGERRGKPGGSSKAARASRRAWRVVLRRQLGRLASRPRDAPVKALKAMQVLLLSGGLVLRAAVGASKLRLDSRRRRVRPPA